MTAVLPSLFGITHSNRNFSDAYYWGKNQFNSAFPVALACYMRSRQIPLVYVRYKDEKSTQLDEIDVGNVFGSTLPNESLYFGFETRFDPFSNNVHDDLPVIDLVVRSATTHAPIRPLEIKLTTIPDNTTESRTEDCYGAELVIRSATMRYMALSMARSVSNHTSRVQEIFEPILAKVRDWDSKSEMLERASSIVSALETFLGEFAMYETPLVMQPLWKTIGKSPVLAPDCLDIFVWSDFALSHSFLDSARRAVVAGKISRQLRAVLRLTRFLYERSRSEKVYQAPIYDGMTYDWQNDKEFSIAGNRSRAFMTCPRLTQPIIPKLEIKNIILGGGHKHLSPERRFDAILYFSKDLFESEE